MRVLSRHERSIVVLCAFVFSMTLVLFLFGRMYYYAKEVGYKEACEDFYKGKLKYDLISNYDGTVREWRKK